MNTLATSIDSFIDNKIENQVRSKALFAGIIGDRPSQYAKSPSLWNHTFRVLQMDAIYTAFDVVNPQKLPGLLDALRHDASYVGGSVTVPYKVQIVPLLDELDSKARQIGAVNTIARTTEGKLIGFNTDGQGAIDSLLRPFAEGTKPFIESLAGLNVVLIGNGGAARAVAFYLAEALGPKGHLTICGRDIAKSNELSKTVSENYGNCSFADEESLTSLMASADLIVNASTKGQAGLRALPNDLVTCLEPYSALGPARPAQLAKSDFDTVQEFFSKWFLESESDIKSNLDVAQQRLSFCRSEAKFFDLIYAPLETTLLRQARFAGHNTLNGKGMNVWQAVDAFVNRVMKNHLPKDTDMLSKVVEAMASVW